MSKAANPLPFEIRLKDKVHFRTFPHFTGTCPGQVKTKATAALVQGHTTYKHYFLEFHSGIISQSVIELPLGNYHCVYY